MSFFYRTDILVMKTSIPTAVSFNFTVHAKAEHTTAHGFDQ